MSALDPLLGTEARIQLAETRYFRGTTYDDVVKHYDELLRTTPDDLLALCDSLADLKKDDAVCVVGGQPLIDACGDRIETVLTL